MPVKHMAEAGLAAGLSTLAETAVVVSTVSMLWFVDCIKHRGISQAGTQPSAALQQHVMSLQKQQQQQRNKPCQQRLCRGLGSACHSCSKKLAIIMHHSHALLSRISWS
jgi:hypothetical protein